MTKQVRIYLFLFLATLLAGLPAYGQVGSGIITMTTAKKVGEQIRLYLYIIADGDFTIEGAEKTSSSGYYYLTDQLIVIRGNVTYLRCNQRISNSYLSYNRLTTLNASGCPTLKTLDCSENELTNLNISGCTALETLTCYTNKLTNLNVSGCTALETLDCHSNRLTALNVSGCTALTKLTCYYNQLLTLYVSGCTALTELDCSENQLTELDVSGCTALTELDCRYNQLTALDVSSCIALTKLDCFLNQLTALDVSQNTALTKLDCSGNRIKDANMTRLVNSLPDRSDKEGGTFVVVQTKRPRSNKCLKSDVAIARTKNWRTKQRIDSSTDKDYLGAGDGEENSVITLTTAKNVGETIYLSVMADGGFTIEGAEEQQDSYGDYKLTAQQVTIRGDVKKLYCRDNQLTALDISHNPALTELNCDGNQLTVLDISKNTALTTLNCFNNHLTALDVSQNTALTSLDCWVNQLTALDVSGCTALTTLNCSYNQLTALDASGCTALTKLECKNNQLTSLNVSGCTALKELSCYKNQLTALDVSGCTALTTLDCSQNQLTSLNVSGCTALTKLGCSQNQLTALDVSGCTALTSLDCWVNQLTALDVSGCTELTLLYCEGNQLTSLDVSGCTALTTLTCYQNQLTALDLSKNTALTKLYCYNNQIKGPEMSLLVKSLVNRPKQSPGKFVVYWYSISEGNHCYSHDVDLAREKNWFTFSTCGDIVCESIYNGKPSTKFSVTQTIEGEGTLNVIGAADLNAVLEDTELTIEAIPAEGYELKALTANGVDILATKKFVVTGSTVVKATFAKPGFAVTLTKDGEGTLNATGAEDLNAVPEGTELTIEASPAEGYELTALTANGADILATKKVVVKEATEVRAIFVKKTFTVTLTKEAGEGKLAATGAADLTAVPFGTELTIEATPAAGYELKTLTANGADILATRKVVVKEAMEVKATFAKKTFAVKLTKEGEGILRSTGAGNLKSVMYATELTIIATPADGYELKALTANGADILATKKVVVKENTEVKAIFTKKIFAVELTQEGEGLLNATGADDLNAVPYGTELTLDATPADGYTLVALTANGADILASKKVVVKEATEVKATFAKKTFTVTLTKEGEGILRSTGAGNLKSVMYATELTIIATPAQGYELKALTANGADILASKKVVVKEDTEVKAIFTKKTFAVELTQEGEGLLNATGADDLNAVPYGTELTIEATPAKGYTLVALTANGTDILTAKKFVVKGATEIKATFTKKTAADSVEAGSVRLYPSPASTYVNVKAAKAEVLVRLYDANGTLLYEARTDDHGMLQIELSAYAEGTYLLLVDGNAQRLLIQR